MLIKGVTKKGDAIPLSPKEALPHAVAIALSEKNTDEHVFWMHKDSVKAVTFSVSDGDVDKKGRKQYVARATGTVEVGKTRIKDDQFSHHKKHTFEIEYASGVDEIGAPHVKINNFSFDKVSTNPSKNVGTSAAVDNLVIKPVVDGGMKPSGEEVTPVVEAATKQSQTVQGGGRISSRTNKK